MQETLNDSIEKENSVNFSQKNRGFNEDAFDSLLFENNRRMEEMKRKVFLENRGNKKERTGPSELDLKVKEIFGVDFCK